MNFGRKVYRHRAVELAVGTALALVFACEARAADAPAAPDTATTAVAAKAAPSKADDSKATEVGGLTVTGTRIIRDGYSAPTPVTVLNTDALIAKAPSNVADALNQLPIFLGSISQVSSNSPLATSVRTGNYLNLRGLGPSRTLILQDGVRVAPSSANGATDINLIPQMLLQRVDVVTGGASSAYGSDAVSGVINFVINSHFEGLETITQAGVSSRGDDNSYKVGIAGGAALMDNRLHLIGSVEHYQSDGIPRKSDRVYGPDNYTQSGTGTAASPISFVPGGQVTNIALGGVITSGALANRQFTSTGDTVPFNVGTIVRPGIAVNGDGSPLYPQCCTLVPTLKTDQIFGRATFDISPDVRAFAQVSYSRGLNTDHIILFQRTSAQMLIFNDNAYLSPATRAALAGTPSSAVGKSFLGFGADPTRVRATGLNAVVGLEGNFANSWKWDVNYVHGDTDYRSVTNTISFRQFYAAIDAVDAGRFAGGAANGNIVCRITLTNPGLMNGCIPINIFGAGSEGLNPAAVASVRRDSIFEIRNKMDFGSANLAGDLVQLWAGPLSFATGVEYRHLSLGQTSNSNPAITTDLTGLRTPPITILQFYQPDVAAVNGAYNVKEGYLELSLPLIKDSPIGKSLELNAAGRYTDYSTSGSVKTWKIGAIYEPVEDLRFRGTISRDIRAPSLNELFAGQSVTTQQLSDPLTGGFGNVQTYSGGNPSLRPEEGTTYTGGISVTPSFLKGFSASIDYYRITIEGAIAAPFTAAQVLNACTASGGTSSICSQINRPISATSTAAANFPLQIFLTNQNVASLKEAGIDFDASYRTSFSGGSLSLHLAATRLTEFTQQQSTTAAAINYLGTALDYTNAIPKWRGNLDANLVLGNFELSAQERYVGPMVVSRLLKFVNNDVSQRFYTDASLAYDLKGLQFGGDVRVFVTVNNLFDQKPPLIVAAGTPGGFYPTSRDIYDIVGRYITVGARAKF